MIIRDFYFGAWLVKRHGYPSHTSNGKVNVEIDKSTLSKKFQEYQDGGYKEYFDCVKQFVKEANNSRVPNANY